MHREASPQLVKQMREVIRSVALIRTQTLHDIVDALLPILASVDANAHGRGRQEISNQVRAILKLVAPDDITPTAARQIERILD